MLRFLFLALLLANAAFFAWAQGYLLGWGVGPVEQSEPHRLAQQIRPEALRVLKPDEVRRAEATASRPAECLQAGLLEETQTSALTSLLERWPQGSWTLESATEAPRWIVYMGKYANADMVNRKKAELRQLGISYEALSNPSLEPGLSLGGFATEAEAQRQLEALAQRGVRTAHVAQERAESRGVRLVLPAVDEALRTRLDELRPTLGSKALRPCRDAAAPAPAAPPQEQRRPT